MNNKGFTLIELLIVTAIVGILAAVALPAYLHFVDRAKVISAVTAMESVVVQMEAYANDHGKYPEDIDFTDFSDQDGRPILGASNWQGVKNKIFSWDNYSTNPGSYALTVSAMDRGHATITATPNSINY